MNCVENAPLKPVKEMEKMERRSADVVTDRSTNIGFVRWKDNKVVTANITISSFNLLSYLAVGTYN